MLRKLKLLKDLSLETKFNAFEKYKLLERFIKEIPKNFILLENFNLIILDDKRKSIITQKIGKNLGLIESWIFLKKKTILILKMKKLAKYFRKAILHDILYKFFYQINLFKN